MMIKWKWYCIGWYTTTVNQIERKEMPHAITNNKSWAEYAGFWTAIMCQISLLFLSDFIWLNKRRSNSSETKINIDNKRLKRRHIVHVQLQFGKFARKNWWLWLVWCREKKKKTNMFQMYFVFWCSICTLMCIMFFIHCASVINN